MKVSLIAVAALAASLALAQSPASKPVPKLANGKPI